MQIPFILGIVLTLTGCGASYDTVKPNMTNKVNQVSYKKVAVLKDDSAINDINRKMGGIILDMKIIPYGNDYVSAKLSVDRYIRFDYIAPLRTWSLHDTSVTEEEGVPANFILTQKIKLPAYKIGINTFDLNDKGNFAYISDKKTIKVVKKIPTDSLKYLSKNSNYSKGNNILTIKTKKAIEQIQFQPKSNNLIVLLENGDIELWNFTKNKKLKTLIKNNKVTSIKVSPKGNYLLASNQKVSKLINIKNNKIVLSIKDYVTAVDFSDNENLLALTGTSKKVSIYNINNKELIQTFEHAHKGLVYGLVFSPVNEETLITAGQDGAIKNWNLLNTVKPLSIKYNTYDNKSHCNAEWLNKQYFPKTSQSLQSFKKRYNPEVTECNILGDKEQVIRFTKEDTLHSYMTSLVDTLVNKYVLIKQEWIAVDVLDSYTGLAKKEIYDWKRSQGYTTVFTNKGTADENVENRFTYNKADYQKFLNTDKKILAYKAQAIKNKTEEYTHLIPQMNAGSIYGLISYGKNIYTYGTGYQNKFSYYQTKTPNVRLGTGIYKYKFDFSNSNQQNIYEAIDKDTFKGAGHTKYVIKTKNEHTIITIRDNLVQFFDYKANKLVDVIAENAKVTSVAYDKKSELLAVGLANNVIKLWDTKNQKPLSQLNGHNGEITALEFVNNGAILISGAYDESAIIWDIKTKKKIKQLRGFERAMKRMLVLPKQKMVAMISSGNNNSDILFYSLKDFKLVKKVSPSAGIIRGVASTKQGKSIILASSGETFNKQKGHILLTLDTDSFKITKKYYNPPFKFIKGLVANEESNTLYAIGSSSTFQRLDLHNLRVVDTLQNMKDDKYGWGIVHAVGVTEQNTPIVADGKGVISIYK